MTMIRSDSGCKVGWSTYDNEDEAREAAERVKVEARDMFAQGYDFGYQSPGEIRVNADKTEWTVTTP